GPQFNGVSNPAPGQVYELSIKKSGDVYEVSVNGQAAQPINAEGFFGDKLYAGLYVARDASVKFTNFDIILDNKAVKSLIVDASEMKKEFLVGQDLDLTGLKVTAEYTDGSKESVALTDLIVLGYDSSTPGKKTITLHY